MSRAQLFAQVLQVAGTSASPLGRPAEVAEQLLRRNAPP